MAVALETVVVMLAVPGSQGTAMALVVLVVLGLLEKVSMALASLVKAGMVLGSREKVWTELASPEGTAKALMVQAEPEKAEMALVAQVSSRVAMQMVLVAQVSRAAPPVEETPQAAEEEKILAGQQA
ncbi:hypothetical protein ZWY2020_044375 [Hordeum vulgare]|nr:hypothetical protein ZWY2020_044375 [Hordeum vulgare]